MMKMNEIIRQRRKGLDLTQEQVAERLGVSASAVHKWETGASCPDVALLLPLARLLGVDMNTLLRFEEELTDQEVGEFLNSLQAALEERGFEAGFTLAMEKLREFPASTFLAGNVAVCLDGARSMYSLDNPEAHAAEIEALYCQAAQCDRQEIRNLANHMLVLKCSDRNDWAEAEALTERLPKATGFDQTSLRISLLLRQERYAEAGKLVEGSLLSAALKVHTLLLHVLDLRLKAGAMADAEEIVALCGEYARLFELSLYAEKTAVLELAVHRRDSEGCLAVLEALFSTTEVAGAVAQSPLYRSLNRKTDEHVLCRLRTVALSGLERDPRLDFLRDTPGFQGLLKKYMP